MTLCQEKLTIPCVLDQPAAGLDQPERRILRQPLGIIDILITRDAAVDGLPKQIGK